MATQVEELTEELYECRGVLVVHADGTSECDDQHECGADEAVHGWWLPCSDLGCGCTGEEADLEVAYLVAA